MEYSFFNSQQRNKLLSSLEENPRKFLLEKMKRGKRTVFSNELAKGKGTFSGSDQELEKEIQQWEFIDLLDGGQGNRPYCCECGMSLRYQYIVKNLETGEIKKFGKNHFEFHTGIPSNIVKDIIKGFERIDYELDEILFKVENGWDSTIVTKAIALKIDIPEDIQEHILLALPLLDRQMSRLHRLVREKELEIMKKSRMENKREGKSVHDSLSAPKIKVARVEPKKLSIKPRIRSPLGEEIHDFIIRLLENSGTISVLEICQELNTVQHDFRGYFSTGKPKVFPYVSMVKDQLKEQGVCKVEKADLDDRWYSVV
ncbi:hypothetical protein ACQKP0_04805 [Heyndrickxia sp. NPDC080065]|uniref:hypothetical protein n=1 Tax=Heyndrickxia sp. NPDC080065 TaxID=3390568 RepID=UPI003D0694FA